MEDDCLKLLKIPSPPFSWTRRGKGERMGLVEIPRLTTSFRGPLDTDEADYHRRRITQNLGSCESSAQKNGNVDDLEFGTDVIFRAPSRFLVDAVDFIEDNGDAAAMEEIEASGAPSQKGLLDDFIGKGDSHFVHHPRKTHNGYIEVAVPAKPTAPLNPGERLVEIKEMDEFAQSAFRGYKTLNRIQSRIYDTTYHTNENILVCAPTGAGKTNIAMISVLSLIKHNLNDKEFKIVYVAPMKALAAEVTSTFSKRLAPLNIVVKELTGDMQLTKTELEETQMIVTTPEKWDVITRKSSDMALLVRLLIIDEVHLLNDERGAVIEALVARTIRQVESSQTMIRIVGLSATLPGYLEVAQFLRVNRDKGLFFFDSSYRPVPLDQQYIGITSRHHQDRTELQSNLCYNKVVESISKGHQAMVFVHSRKDTAKTAETLVELAKKHCNLDLFQVDSKAHPQIELKRREVLKSRNKDVVKFYEHAIGIHHAGMLRSDRSMTERLFSEGLLKVLVCTATLAWGVNLPAHTVVIKGTQVYDTNAGCMKDLGMLDVMQIFGRAGRPQFDKSGEGIIITSSDKLDHYLQLLTDQMPIESQFISSLKDNLNAEANLGSVTNVKEALENIHKLWKNKNGNMEEQEK